VGEAEYYLTRNFQNEKGVRRIDYIKYARLEYAKVCLLSTERSVEEISDLLQFSSRNYFTRVFREKTGMTPTEFRTQKLSGQ
ncbi:MAG: helix-turn-helix transcriptional regulator, partial [Lachnospiraceae bacterium]|nr:helix-turn-helix transcriptional regulator [Lachnospiraceae bacterium]